MPKSAAALALLMLACSVTSGFVLSAPASAQQIARANQSDISFMYFGSRDCPVCRRFVSRDIHQVKAVTGANDIAFVRKEVWNLRSIIEPGSFGSYDELQKAAMRKAGKRAVPLYAVVRNGKLVAARAGDWRTMMNLAVSIGH